MLAKARMHLIVMFVTLYKKNRENCETCEKWLDISMKFVLIFCLEK